MGVSTTAMQMQRQVAQAQSERIDSEQEATSGVEPGAEGASDVGGRIEVCTVGCREGDVASPSAQREVTKQHSRLQLETRQSRPGEPRKEQPKEGRKNRRASDDDSDGC